MMKSTQSSRHQGCMCTESASTLLWMVTSLSLIRVRETSLVTLGTFGNETIMGRQNLGG